VFTSPLQRLGYIVGHTTISRFLIESEGINIGEKAVFVDLNMEEEDGRF
jgi:hypothetical protein